MKMQIEIPDCYAINQEELRREITLLIKNNNNIRKVPMSWDDIAHKSINGYWVADSSVGASKFYDSALTLGETPSNWIVCPNENEVQAVQAILKLRILYNEWTKMFDKGIKDEEEERWIIVKTEKFLGVTDYLHLNGIAGISFADKNIAEKFLNTFKDLFETASEFYD